ncbi:hypothetical protein [Spirosoma telluris]|uniref:YncE family protein n=1 Tax=Spirosoma telluris TaxID=2183553 RepID=UPI002FC32B2F
MQTRSSKTVSVSSDGSRVYRANNNSNSVSVINTVTNTVIATIDVGDRPHGVSMSSDGSRVYVVNLISQTVSVINAATNTVVNTVSFPTNLDNNLGNFVAPVRCSGTSISFTITVLPSATCTSQYTIKAGSWTDVSIWSCGRLPTVTDVVTLSHEVGLPSNYQGQAFQIIYSQTGRLIMDVNNRLLLEVN